MIGGGFAGLAAASALAETGASVHLLEARPALGGRAATFRDPATGERIDNGQHVLAGCYTETLAFLRRIKALGGLHRPSALQIPMIDQRGVRSVLSLPPLPSPFHLLAGVLAWDALSVGERWSVLRIARPLMGHGAADRQDETVRQWLERHGQSPRLCMMLWEPLALAALNQHVDAAAASSFLAVIRRLFGPEPDASTLLLPAVPLDALYAQPAADFLRDAGSRVTLNAPARLRIAGGRVVGVAVRDEVMPAERVVVAVPWFALRSVCEPPPPALEPVLRNASALGSSPIVTVNLWFDGPSIDDRLVGLPGRTFQWVFDRRSIVGTDVSHLSLVSSGAQEVCDETNDALVARALGELQGAVARLRGLHPSHASVVRERRATFSLEPGSPPRPRGRTPVEGLWLAGDWIDTGLPATIESAVLSGHMAARAMTGSS